MKVTYKEHMGSDLSVVNAARVSFSKESAWETYNPLEGTEFDVGYYANCLSDKDKKLIKYLAEHNHWSPFSHCFVSFHIKAPIFVTRQLAKHVVGLSWNEVSRRYVDTPPELYWPAEWRKKAANKKQGSSDEVVDKLLVSVWDKYGDESLDEIKVTEVISRAAEDALYNYRTLIRQGVCPEQARMILPLNTYTEFLWSGSLYAFARVVNLRTTMDTQKETKEIALQIKQILLELFPESAKALLTNTGEKQ